MRRAFAASTAIHAAVAFALFIRVHFSWPAPPIPIELTTPPAHRTVERTGEERRGDPRAATGKPQKPRPRTHGAGPRPVEKPAQQPPPSTADLSPFAPDDANLVLLLRTDKLRRSPHRANIEALVAALPACNTLLAGTGVDPLDDFDALLIATANPRDVTATFLAARYHESERIRALAGRALGAGDPRVFRFLGPGLAVLTRPDGAARLDDARAVDGGEDPRTRWLAELTQLDRVGADERGPSLLVSLSNATSLLRFGGGLPTPEAMALAATAEADPAVRVKLVFANEAAAIAFASAWPDVLRRWHAATTLVGLGPALDGLALERAGATIELAGRVPEAQVRIGLAIARSLLPPPEARQQLTPPTEDDVDGGEPLR
jgi:hypothetical protein